MPHVVAAAAAVIGQAVFAVTSVVLPASAAAAATVAATTFVASLGGLAGFGAAVSAWSTVAAVASLASSALPRKPRVGISESGGTQVDFQADPQAGVPLVLGKTGVAGKIVHLTVDGQAYKNAHLLFVSVLSVGPCASIDSFKAGDIAVSFTGEIGGGVAAGGVGPEGADNRYDGKMVLRTQLGSKPQPDTGVPWVPDRIPEWTSAHQLSGLAFYWYGLESDPKAYATGVPPPLVELTGPAVYDPRLDGTYPGGSGACRADDEATWTFVGNDNPYLQALTFAIGRRANGKLTHGLGLAPVAIDLEAFVEGANVCDANGWTIGGEVSSTDRKRDVLAAMLQAGGGRMSKRGGKLSCVVATPRVSLDTWTGAELIGDAQITATQARRDRINAIRPRYRSPDHGYEMVAMSPVAVDTYVAEDGGQRSREADYILVQQAQQSGQLAAYDICDSREFGPIILPSKPRWWGYRAGDAITVDEPELGLNGQQVLVLDRTVDPASGAVTLTCKSETAAKHDFALGRTDVAPPTPGLTGIDPSFVPTPDDGDWAIVDNQVDGPGGVAPAIVVAGDIGDAIVDQVILDYRRSTNPPTNTTFEDWVTIGYPASTTRMAVMGVVAGATYQGRVRYRNTRGVEGGADESFDLGLVTTGNSIPTGGTDPDDEDPPAAPSDLAAYPGFGSIWLDWTNPSDGDFDHAAIYESATDDVADAVFAGTDGGEPGSRGTFYVGNLPTGAQRWFWVKALDRSGNASDFSNRATATTASIDPVDLGTAVGFGYPSGLALSSALALDTDGSQLITLTASWTAISDPGLSHYVLELQEASGSFVPVTVDKASTSFILRGVKANTSYTARVKAVNTVGIATTTSPTVSHTTTRDTTAPSAPTSLVVTPGIGTFYLSWTNPADADLTEVEIWEHTSNSSGSASRVATVNAIPGAAGKYARTGLGTGVVRWFWLKARDASGNVSVFSTGNADTTALVLAGDITVSSVLANSVVSFVTTTNILNANVLQTTSSLPGSITVGSTGVTITTVEARASDPAARINAQTTTIGPGKIQLTGSTTLDNWLYSGDLTLIDGGKIGANTITANSAEIGLRGIDINGLAFSFASPGANLVSWTAGKITYYEGGSAHVIDIIAGDSSTTPPGINPSGPGPYVAPNTVWIYWIKDETFLRSTTTAATAHGATKVQMATYRGGADLNANYGRTLITDDFIRTGGISTNSIAAGAITSTLIGASQINAGHIATRTLTADKIFVGTLTFLEVEGGGISTLTYSTTTPALSLTSSEQSVVSRTLATGDDDIVLILVRTFVRNYDSFQRTLGNEFYRDGSNIGSGGPPCPLSALHGAYVVDFEIDEPPANTTVTYSLKQHTPDGTNIVSETAEMRVIRWRR